MTNEGDSIFRLLAKHGIPFCVIGGHAVSVHGYIRATEDQDIVFLRTSANEERLLAALKEINACWIDDEIDPATGVERLVPITPGFIKGHRLMMLVSDLGFLDLFDYVPGCDQASAEDLLNDAVEIGGVKYASKDWLLRMKRAAGRPKDLLDIENLE